MYNTMSTQRTECCEKCNDSRIADNQTPVPCEHCPCHSPTDESVVDWEKEFMEKYGMYTNEYSYVHKIPNCDEIIKFIRTLLTNKES